MDEQKKAVSKSMILVLSLGFVCVIAVVVGFTGFNTLDFLHIKDQTDNTNEYENDGDVTTKTNNENVPPIEILEYFSEENGVSFEYPSDWMMEENNYSKAITISKNHYLWTIESDPEVTGGGMGYFQFPTPMTSYEFVLAKPGSYEVKMISNYHNLNTLPNYYPNDDAFSKYKDMDMEVWAGTVSFTGDALGFGPGTMYNEIKDDHFTINYVYDFNEICEESTCDWEDLPEKGSEELKSMLREMHEITQSVKLTENTESSGSSISGGLSYPSEMLPPMKVCAVNTLSKEETCIENAIKTFTISVEPGTYLVYSEANAEVSDRVYYTKCDTYEDTFIPECNPNAPGSTENWHATGFICYENPICKSAFTPLEITVRENEKIQLKTIQQGWYIPCPDPNLCNDPTYEKWSFYLD